jgi:hypothetical protein
VCLSTHCDMFCRGSLFLCPSTLQLIKNAKADSGFPCDKTEVLKVTTKETPCTCPLITWSPETMLLVVNSTECVNTSLCDRPAFRYA